MILRIKPKREGEISRIMDEVKAYANSKQKAKQSGAHILYSRTRLKRPTEHELKQNTNKGKSNCEKKSRFLRSFYFILSVEFSLIFRLPFIWNSNGFKSIIKLIGISQEVITLFNTWYDGKTFNSKHWIRFNTKINKFELKSKFDFCQETDEKFGTMSFNNKIYKIKSCSIIHYRTILKEK